MQEKRFHADEGDIAYWTSELTSDALLGIPAEKVKDDDDFSHKHPTVSTIPKLCPGAIIGLIAVLSFMIIAKYIRDFIFIGLG